ncbi:PREDICTED: fasciclin-like arabinogalactan protein 7 [Camelina sativa]|uniref:Fasciclin-like arabinogalactan protein 7 n=1 Tax=Camelina sativa TaxID=90675 RepID=A0ABM0ZPE1_CAMSA|nr:PREDICTED: fasciclin-like arabinogalactan protein 7 [Camelina sativa]XP_010518644.1 PREDICTED: fasciclin-like arabinogalactan protein 7 [Camelina sativa]
MAKMQFSIFIAVVALMVCSASAKTLSPPAPMLPPTPAPAPAPENVNLTALLSVAGPFHTFLDYLLSTGVIETLQNQANNTEEGVTIFVPKDDAFKAQKNPPLSNLTKDQLKQLLLFHALPHYYSLSEFKNLSQSGPVNTFAGGQYSLKFTDVSGTVRIDSLWTRTKVSSSVFSTDPVAVYQVNRVLLPEAIFGTDVPPMPAPAPAPVVSAPSDSPSAADSEGANASSPTSSHKNSGQKMALAPIAMVVSGLVALLL